MAKDVSKNKAKRAPDGRADYVLWRIHTVQKNRKSTVMLMAIREDHVEEFRDIEGFAVLHEYI